MKIFKILFILTITSQAQALDFTTDDSGGAGNPFRISECQTVETSEKMAKSVGLYVQLLKRKARYWVVDSKLYFGNQIKIGAFRVGFSSDTKPAADIEAQAMHSLLSRAAFAFNALANSPAQKGYGCTVAHYQVEQFRRDVNGLLQAHIKQVEIDYSRCIEVGINRKRAASTEDFNAEMDRCWAVRKAVAMDSTGEIK